MDFEELEEEEALEAAKQHLLEALGDLSESISFCASGTRPLTLPGLNVEGIGEVALPVSRSDARRLIVKANQAPYGRGEATVVDTDVRRVWQLEPDQFRLENPKWEPFVREIAKSVKAEFGIKQKVTASLYKLLVYEKGSFFVPHRDTEKAHRMFATLVICLPSKHKGGQLIVSHSGQSQVVDFSDEASAYDLQYAAFYADCEHEVRPVTDGHRICLVYTWPPADAKTNLNCDCADCQQLASFLKDKDAQVHRFPRRKDLRQHFHRQIDEHRIDCAHLTERRGRPYTLVCTKNQASFERELKQYKTDCRLLKELTDG